MEHHGTVLGREFMQVPCIESFQPGREGPSRSWSCFWSHGGLDMLNVCHMDVGKQAVAMCLAAVVADGFATLWFCGTTFCWITFWIWDTCLQKFFLLTARSASFLIHKYIRGLDVPHCFSHRWKVRILISWHLMTSSTYAVEEWGVNVQPYSGSPANFAATWHSLPNQNRPVTNDTKRQERWR